MSSKPVAAIVGMGDAYASRENRKDPLQLAAESTVAALADAGIHKNQVDAIFTGRSPWADKRSQWNNIFASHMQMHVTFSSELTMHGAGLTSTIAVASQMIAAGKAEYVLCLQSDATELFVDAVAMGAEADADPQFEAPYGPTIRPSTLRPLAVTSTSSGSPKRISRTSPSRTSAGAHTIRMQRRRSSVRSTARRCCRPRTSRRRCGGGCALPGAAAPGAP